MTELEGLKPLKSIMAESIVCDLQKLLVRMRDYQKMQPTSGVADSISKIEKICRRMEQEG